MLEEMLTANYSIQSNRVQDKCKQVEGTRIQHDNDQLSEQIKTTTIFATQENEHYEAGVYFDSISLPEKGAGKVQLTFTSPSTPRERGFIELLYRDKVLTHCTIKINTRNGYVSLDNYQKIPSASELKKHLQYFTTTNEYKLIASVTEFLQEMGFSFNKTN